MISPGDDAPDAGTKVARDVHRQLGAGVRFEWGITGARSLAHPQGVVVVVDVLSFTTTVAIAVAKGTKVLPFRWRDPRASAFAQAEGAVLAVGRSEMRADHPWSLSGAALIEAPPIERLVLPSPNGSAICAAVQGQAELVVAASLRNASAVAPWLLRRGFGSAERPICVVAAGELWESDGALRPSLEDLLGAGAVISRLIAAGCDASPEAALAAATYAAIDDVPAAVRSCASGIELAADGYPADVEVAVDLGVDSVVPVLLDGGFVDGAAMDGGAGTARDR